MYEEVNVPTGAIGQSASVPMKRLPLRDEDDFMLQQAIALSLQEASASAGIHSKAASTATSSSTSTSVPKVKLDDVKNILTAIRGEASEIGGGGSALIATNDVKHSVCSCRNRFPNLAMMMSHLF